jgi:Na+/H+-dicarboxylate symporter
MKPSGGASSNRLTTLIMIALILGIVVGYICHLLAPNAAAAHAIAGYFMILTNIFLRLIRMIIAPLVFSTLVAGIASLGDTRAVGRIAIKSLGWFITASLVSLLLGMLLVNTLAPGSNLNLPRPPAGAETHLAALNFSDFITHIFPTSAIQAMAQNEILQILVFSVFFRVRARLVQG